MPQHLPPQTLVRHTRTVGDGVGSVLVDIRKSVLHDHNMVLIFVNVRESYLQRDNALLQDLAVLGAGVDAIYYHALALLVKLLLEHSAENKVMSGISSTT